MRQNFRRDVQLCFCSFSSVAATPERILRFAVVSCAFLASGMPAAYAAPINYGDFMGTDFTYEDVTEDSNSGDTPPLYGPPTVSGNSLDFTPVGFSAFAANGAADITDGNLAFMVTAKPNRVIQNIKITEFGDTTLAGLGSDNTMTAAVATGVLNIHEVDGTGINVVSVPVSFTMSPSGGTYGLGTDGGGGPVFNTQWMGMLFVDVQQTLIAHNIPFEFGATKISLDYDNRLIAVSQEATTALIAKKDHLIITTNIPEPAACTLAVLGMLASALVWRRSH